MSIIRKNEPVHDYLKLAEGAHADEIAKLTKAVSIREQEKDGFKTVQFFVFFLKDGPNYQRSHR